MLTFIRVGLALAMSAVLIRVCFEPLWRLRRDVRQLSEIGVGEVGRVLAIEQTGTEINDQPEMRVELDIHPAGGVRRQVTVKQLTDMGSIPRVGDIPGHRPRGPDQGGYRRRSDEPTNDPQA